MLLACERLRHNTCSSCLRGGRKLCRRIPSRESHVRRMSMAQCRLPALFAPWTFHDAKRADKPHSERTQPRTHGCRERIHKHTGYSLHLLCLKFVFISNQVLITCHVMSTWLDIKTNWRQSKSAALLKSRCCVEASKHNSQRRHKTSLAVRKDTQEAHVNLSNQLAATPC